jgi:hypothetical protein
VFASLLIPIYLAVNECHVRLWKTSPLNCDLRKGALDLAQVISRYLDVDCAEIFLETLL